MITRNDCFLETNRNPSIPKSWFKQRGHQLPFGRTVTRIKLWQWKKNAKLLWVGRSAWGGKRGLTPVSKIEKKTASLYMLDCHPSVTQGKEKKCSYGVTMSSPLKFCCVSAENGPQFFISLHFHVHFPRKMVLSIQEILVNAPFSVRRFFFCEDGSTFRWDFICPLACISQIKTSICFRLYKHK